MTEHPKSSFESYPAAVRAISILLLALATFAPLDSAWAREKADFVYVDKSDKRLSLMKNGKVLHSFRIALGGNPTGHKQQEGDQRTPEGRYTLDSRKKDSHYYRAIHVSYPNAADRAAAKTRGVSPGGDIMVHGQKNGWGWIGGAVNRTNWTDGCIALKNKHMDIVWELVDDGTPIEIVP